MTTGVKGYLSKNSGPEDHRDVTVTDIGSVKTGLDVVTYAGPSTASSVNTYAEVTSVGSATRTLIVTYTVPAGNTFYLERVEFAGNNIATYEVEFDGVVNAKKYTWFGGDISGDFDFSGSAGEGSPFTPTQTVRLYVTHNRPTVGDFNGRIQGSLRAL